MICLLSLVSITNFMAGQFLLFVWHAVFYFYSMTLRVPDILGNTVAFSDNIIAVLLYEFYFFSILFLSQVVRVSIHGIYITFLLSMTLVIVICLILVSIFPCSSIWYILSLLIRFIIVCDLILVLLTCYVQLISFGSGSLYVGLHNFYVNFLRDLWGNNFLNFPVKLSFSFSFVVACSATSLLDFLLDDRHWLRTSRSSI